MTSNQLNIRLPARAGLDASEPDSQKVSEGISDLLSCHCGDSEKILKLNGNPKELQGYYRIEQESRSLFLKVLPESYLEQQKDANRFAVFVQNGGVQASTIIPGYPKYLGNGLIVIAYDWIEGRCLDLSQSELEQFGFQLGRLHHILGQYPTQKIVCGRTYSRLAVLREIVKRIKALEQIESSYIKRLRGLLQENRDFFKPFSEPCQVLHGDLNIGNLRWVKSKVVFLDFEDAKHSWFPPRIDVAFALERLALINEPDTNHAFINAQALLGGYVESFGHSPFLKKGTLKSSLEWLSTRSLCMLQHFEWGGMAWPESEWLKFDGLLDHLTQRSEMMLELEACFFD